MNAILLVNFRRISQILFFIIFLLIISQTRNHSYLEEERTARLEENNISFYYHSEKAFPILYFSSAFSLIFFVVAFILIKKKKISFKEIRNEKKLFSIILVSSIIFIFSIIFILVLDSKSYLSVSKASPALRIKITPTIAWIILILFLISLLIFIFLFIKRIIIKRSGKKIEKFIYYFSVLCCIFLILIIFSIGSFNPDTRNFKPGPNNIPLFSFDKYLYNLDVPSTLFIETSALIGLSTSIASKVITISIVYIFGMLIIALIFGRSFCGWVCPFGSLHHFISFFAKKIRNKKFPNEKFNAFQRLKYIFLIIIISSSIFGITLTGLFDPFGVFNRLTTVFILPSARSIFEKKITPQQITEKRHLSGDNQNSSAQSQNNSYSEINNSQTDSSLTHSQNYNSYITNQRTEQSNEQQQRNEIYDRRSARSQIKREQQKTQDTINNSSISTKQNITLQEKLLNFFKKIFFSKEKKYFEHFVINGILFFVLISLNFIKTRFWCRYICALGALYGIIGKYSIMRIKQNEKCVNCKECSKFCQGACNPDLKDDFKSAECIYCFNCLKNCKFNALEITFGWEIPLEKEPKQINFKKRTFIKSLGIGLGSMFLFKTNFFEKRVNPDLIRPPGALYEPDFLERCIKCGNCIQICPNNFLQPTLFEAGILGIFTPMGNPKFGFCSPTCTLCSHACPTGAIRYLKENDRGDNENGLPKLKIGTAHINKNRCMTYVHQKKCLVCEEHCPTSPKAIWAREEKVITREGKKIIIGQPVISPERCIGCGVCVYVCPVVDEPGIRLTSIGETRNPFNDFSLTRQEN